MKGTIDEMELLQHSVARTPRMVDLRFALAGGAVAAIALFAGVALVGSVSPYEGSALVGAMLPTARFLTSTVIAAGTTILALMLTLLGFTYTTRFTFRSVHFARVRQVSLLASVAIVLAVITLLFLSLPVDEADGLRLYYDVIYYGLTTAGSMLGGLMVAIVLMLHRTIGGLVAIGHPTAQSELIEESPNAGADDCR